MRDILNVYEKLGLPYMDYDIESFDYLDQMLTQTAKFTFRVDLKHISLNCTFDHNWLI